MNRCIFPFKLAFNKVWLILIVVFVFPSFLNARHLPLKQKLHLSTNNPCNVIANFTPNNDSVISINTNPKTILFTNASLNATSITWYINGLWLGTENTLNFSFYTPGTYEVKLIAVNGTCSDTVISYVLYAGQQPPNRDNIKAYYGFPGIEDNSNAMIASYDGGYLIGGQTQLRGQTPQSAHYHSSDAFLQKIDESVCIKWTKLIPARFSGKIFKLVQLKDSNYAVLGSLDDIPYLRKIDRLGNLIWNKNFNTEAGLLNLSVITETSDGGFVLAGGATITSGIEIVRTDAYGNILWNKLYSFANELSVNQAVLSILQKDDAVYVTCYVQWSGSYPDNIFYSYNNLIKLNNNNGQTQWTKTYTINGKYTNPVDILSTNTGLLLNCVGTIGIQNNFITLDTNGNILASIGLEVQGITANVANSKALIQDNGDIYVLNNGTEILNLQPYYAYHSTFIVLDKLYTPKWTMDYSSYVRGRYFYPAIGNNGTFAAIGDEIGSTLATYSSLSNKIQFQKIDAITDPSKYYCGMNNTTTTIINTFAATQNFSWTTDSTLTLGLKDTGITTLTTVYSEARFKCPIEFIDSCNFLKVTGPGSICNLSNSYTYKIHRNKACNEPVQWQVNFPGIIINKTDSSITVKFTSFGTYVISALLPFACTPIKDSILISVASKSPTLNIGSDTSICVGNTLSLNAGEKFFTYKWQDGSSNKTFNVTLPGIYWIQVADSCNNIFNDTITVALKKALPINAGPDRIKCNGDTLQLIAPQGFINYAWLPDYFISDKSLAKVIVNPLIDTSYNLKAEISPGCFAYDTIHVTVLHSPTIYLGADTSICAGNIVNLNSGAGFTQYTWNTGAKNQQLSITNAGFYSVAALAPNGCFSYDTIQLKTVYPLPQIKLDTNSVICIGTSRILDAGAGFIDYLWNNGSSLRTLVINSPGIYIVKVTDINTCTATAKTEIDKAAPLPAHFLSGDTSICSYGTVIISSLKQYNRYLWSNNTTESSTTITSQGIYWLTVTDNNNCTGTDTILINKKNCIEGIFVPKAFSPNGDRKNDLFKPLLFGNVLNYHFIIYNRFGQPVFESTALNEGWDGTIKGIEQNGNAFVWVCTYQFVGTANITSKGSVLVIR